jgi:hypothetical protein
MGKEIEDSKNYDLGCKIITSATNIKNKKATSDRK